MSISTRRCPTGGFREACYFRYQYHHDARSRRCASVREDIPLLCAHFFQKLNRRYQQSLNGISPAAYQLLIRFPVAGERPRARERD